MPRYILTINGGSSSVKVALFESGATLEKKSHASIKSPNSQDAAGGVFQWLKSQADLSDIAAIGHRIVHGGPRYTDHSRISSELIDQLRGLSPIDPNHLPGEIALIEAFQKHCPTTPQVACFDTVFHRDLPDVAKRLPLPRKYADAGIRRYGFHGLSYAYLMEELTRQTGQAAANGRVILAHLGAGASMAAVKDGRCIDTTMSFTPTAGLVMATRTGDLDPGVLVYLMREEKLAADEIDELINKKSGLLGVSSSTSDMRDLLSQRATNRDAALAIDLFCYQARKWIGAFAAALGGLDTIVFSGGIGENSPEVRSQVCAELGYLGATIDGPQNKASAPVISTSESQVIVRVIPTDEELMIAKIVQRILARGTA
jgi:acetate kinase